MGSNVEVSVAKCSVDGCFSAPRRRTASYCEMHYYRQRRTGTTDRIEWSGAQRRIHSNGYVLLHAPGHPLAKRNLVYEHRKVFHEQHGEGPFNCHWCGKVVTWVDMHVDHVNADPTDNRAENLVPSCPLCNQKRGIPKMTRRAREGQGVTLTFNGETMCLGEWAARLGLSRASLRGRLHAGWPLERALTQARGRFGPRSQRE